MKSSNCKIDGFNYNEADQTFSMTLEEFRGHLEHVVVCQLQKSMTYSACPVKFQQSRDHIGKVTLHWVEMKVQKEGQVSIALN